jgi:hypothetical protein
MLSVLLALGLLLGLAGCGTEAEPAESITGTQATAEETTAAPIRAEPQWEGTFYGDMGFLRIENVTGTTFHFVYNIVEEETEGTAKIDVQNPRKAALGYVFELSEDNQAVTVTFEGWSGQYTRGDEGRGDYLPEDPADVNWWGEYASETGTLGVTNFDQNSEGIWHFRFTLERGGKSEQSVAAVGPDDYAFAQWGEITFHFFPAPSGDEITVEGGGFDGIYRRVES